MKKINCPLCDENYTSLSGLYEHIEEDHEDDIPKNFTPSQYVYFLHTGKTDSKCVICKRPTEWNETTGKYNRFCPDPKCKEKYRKQFEKRMMGKYGKTTLLNDPDQQRKMLEHRHISGKYEWSDGTIKTYTGTYELDFLKMMDLFLGFDSNDLLTPSPHTYYYMYENEKKFYIPDAYIPSLNLEIEVKQGGSNPNRHPNMIKIDKVKENLKDDVMRTQKNINYLKIVDKDYTEFFKYLADRKSEFLNNRIQTLNQIVVESDNFLDSIDKTIILDSGLIPKSLQSIYEDETI